MSDMRRSPFHQIYYTHHQMSHTDREIKNNICELFETLGPESSIKIIFSFLQELGLVDEFNYKCIIII